jgi:hypothetical protein
MQIADQLRLHATAPDEVHYELDHKGKQATLTEAGLHAVYAKLGRSSLQLINKKFKTLQSGVCNQLWLIRHPDYPEHGMQQAVFTQSKRVQFLSIGLMLDQRGRMNWETGRLAFLLMIVLVLAHAALKCHQRRK